MRRPGGVVEEKKGRERWGDTWSHTKKREGEVKQMQSGGRVMEGPGEHAGHHNDRVPSVRFDSK